MLPQQMKPLDMVDPPREFMEAVGHMMEILCKMYPSKAGEFRKGCLINIKTNSGEYLQFPVGQYKIIPPTPPIIFPGGLPPGVKVTGG